MHRLLTTICLGVLSISPALAHPGIAASDGLIHGFSHPISGMDHVLAMVGAGILAARFGGRALWLAPSAFITLMIIGGMLGMTGVAVSSVDIGVALSVVVIGVIIAVGQTMPISAAMALVGAFAIFHGYAHGTEMPETASGLEYGTGFVAATALLHAVGISLTLTVNRIGQTHERRIVRIAGGLMAAAGGMLIVGIV